MLRELVHPIDFVPEAMPGHKLLDKFIQEKKHMVAVVNEYGGFEGVVTLEDVLECLIGVEIVDEHDKVEVDILVVEQLIFVQIAEVEPHDRRDRVHVRVLDVNCKRVVVERCVRDPIEDTEDLGAALETGDQRHLGGV